MGRANTAGSDGRMIRAKDQVKHTTQVSRAALNRQVGLGAVLREKSLLGGPYAGQCRSGTRVILIDPRGQIDLVRSRIAFEVRRQSQDRILRGEIENFEHNSVGFAQAAVDHDVLAARVRICG